jgi:hypothetical protein
MTGNAVLDMNKTVDNMIADGATRKKLLRATRTIER